MRDNFYSCNLPLASRGTHHPNFKFSIPIKRKLHYLLVAAILFLAPYALYAQAPSLGTAANFVFFTSSGAVTHVGSSHITGNVGSNSGSSTGFGNVDGAMENNNGVTATSATNLLTAYNQLNSAVPTATLAPLLGNGSTLFAGVYHITSAATLNLALNLDAQGDPNALFIFQIDGPLSTNTLSRVNLLNNALACNVFWKVEGLVSMAAFSTMRGNIIANNAAINMNVGDTLEGRALSTTGAISVNGIVAYTPIGCGSTYLTGPAVPALASTASYGVFSGNGQVTNTGVTHVTGDVGTNLGTTTGFNPLFVSGTIHLSPDASTATCAADLGNVYTYLNTLPYDIDLLYPAQFGNDLVLTPHTYLMNAAANFTGSVYLNGEGNPNAVFVIKINGALTAGTFSRVVLINGTQAKNVFWKVDGAINIGDNSLFNGNMIANNGAILLGVNDTLNGRALTTNGAVSIQSSNINIIPAACIAPAINGDTSVCSNDTTTLSDPISGGRWSSSNPIVASIDSVSGLVSGLIPGNTTITYVTSAGCVSTLSFTVNPLPAPITGPGFVCSGSNIVLHDITPNGTWSSSNILQATAGSTSGIITGLATGSPTISYTLTTGCAATKIISVNSLPDAGLITGPSTVCVGSSILLTDTATGGIWSSSNNNAVVLGGLVSGIASGIDTITYTVTNVCGTDATSKIITINPQPDAGTISGPSSLCAGSSILLTDNIANGTWSSSNNNATVANGLVTGISAGVDTIWYTIGNSCGIDTASHIITVNPLLDAGVITGPARVCVGSSIVLDNVISGGTWSSSNSNATISGNTLTGVVPGIDTIYYTVTGICTASSEKIITINELPPVPVISTQSPSTVCAGAMYQNFGSAVQAPPATTYDWSAQNATVWAQGTGHQYALVSFNTPANAHVTLTATSTSTGCTSSSEVSITVGTDIAQTPTVVYFNNHFVCTPNNEHSYQWGYDDANSLDSTILSGEINQDYINTNPAANKLYWVMTTSGGCLQKTYYTVPTAIQAVNNDANSISVYPNPANSFINVSVNTTAPGNLQIVIANMMGQQLSTAQTANNKASINIDPLPAGVYLVSCYSNGIKLASTRFIKN